MLQSNINKYRHLEFNRISGHILFFLELLELDAVVEQGFDGPNDTIPDICCQLALYLGCY
jgi:hypothetical protein